MTPERYNKLEFDLTQKLTEEEIKEGWHFCDDWDGMLVGKEMPEYESCYCKYETNS